MLANHAPHAPCKSLLRVGRLPLERRQRLLGLVVLPLQLRNCLDRRCLQAWPTTLSRGRLTVSTVRGQAMANGNVYLRGRELGLQRLDLPFELLGLRGMLALELADANVQALYECEHT